MGPLARNTRVAHALWDRIAATHESIPVPAWHREIIDERGREFDVDPDAGDDWDVVQERLRKKFDNHGQAQMARRFIVRPLAEADLEDAARWYQNERAGSRSSSSAMSIRHSRAYANGRSSSSA